jgi:hypothetical protein
MAQLLDETRSHYRTGPFGDKGDDSFTINIPPPEVYDKVQLTILEATGGGGARITEEPLVGQSGQRTLKVRWFYNAFGKIRYRITAFSKAAFNTPPVDADLWELLQAKISGGHENGVHGFYLKRVGGSVLFACNEELVFDPASSIKVLVHAHALRRVQAGAASLSTMIPVPGNLTLPQPRGVNCPFDEQNTPIDTLPLTLRRALQAMMLRSRNAPTEAIRRFFGAGNINNTAQDVGMNKTRYDNAPGCGQNKTTLVDLGKLYEAAATSGMAFSTSPIALNWETFVELAWHASIPEMDALVAAAASQGLGSGFVANYRSMVVNVNKSGSGGDQTGQKVSLAGYIGLPLRARRHGGIGLRGFVYGIFIDKASRFAAGYNQVDVLMEMLRPSIVESVRSLG